MFLSVKNVLEEDTNSRRLDATSTMATTSKDDETSDYDDDDDDDINSRTVKPPLRNPVVTTMRTTTFDGDFETVETHKVNKSCFAEKMSQFFFVN